MSRTEFEQIFSEVTAEKTTRKLEFIELDSDMERTEFGPNEEVTSLCAYLKNWIIFSSSDFYLVPLLPNSNQESLVSQLYIAWNDQELRRGYTNELPTEKSAILPVVERWKINSKGIFWKVCKSEEGILAYVRLGFNEREDKIIGEIVYGNLRPDLQRRGVMTNAVGVALQGLCELADKLELSKQIVAETTLSDNNLGSVKVASRNGFIVDWAYKPDPPPIKMGGDYYRVYKTLRTGSRTD